MAMTTTEMKWSATGPSEQSRFGGGSRNLRHLDVLMDVLHTTFVLSAWIQWEATFYRQFLKLGRLFAGVSKAIFFVQDFCDVFSLTPEELISIMGAHSGSLKRAVQWILHGESGRDTFAFTPRCFSEWSGFVSHIAVTGLSRFIWCLRWSSGVHARNQNLLHVLVFAEGCVPWTPDDDNVVLHGDRTTLAELKSRHGEEEVAKRRTVLLNAMKEWRHNLRGVVWNTVKSRVFTARPNPVFTPPPTNSHTKSYL